MNQPRPKERSSGTTTGAVPYRTAAKLHSLSGIYTSEAVASVILDLVGWKVEEDLVAKRLLEPAAGDGVFLRLAAERLILSARRWHRHLDPISLQDAITGYEIWPGAARSATEHIFAVLVTHGIDRKTARSLSKSWIRQEDFVQAPIKGTFTHIVGNPPYVRWSKIPRNLQSIYHRELPSGIAGGDLCVPFLYRCVNLLAPTAALGFICSDRWLRSEYGRALRCEMNDTASLELHLELRDFAAFDLVVDAYAAISVLRRKDGSRFRGSCRLGEIHTLEELKGCSGAIGSDVRQAPVHRIGNPLADGAPIVVSDGSLERAIRRVPKAMPMIEAAGCVIRVGAALGHAPAYVCPKAENDVEPDLLLPYMSSSDIGDDGIVRSDRVVINPFTTDGGLIDLRHYPKLRRRLTQFKRILSRRHCVKEPAHWYRTIDVIDPAFAATPKILIAGIAKRPRLAIDPGGFQPGNSVYAILPGEWPIAALYRLLQSGVMGMFVAGYSPRMSGGFLRFHKAILRNIRLPRWTDLPRSFRLAISAEPSADEVRGLIADQYNVPRSILRRYS